MRIVYDIDGSWSPSPRAPTGMAAEGRTRVETVIVISPARDVAGGADDRDENSPDGGIGFRGDGYEVRISDEALARDREVRSHEQAHLAALGGAAASGIVYNTVTGPGGEKIAVGGRIKVDTAEVPGDPAATLRKARAIIAAAGAPANPSAADMRTSARAYQMARDALREIAGGLVGPTEKAEAD